MVLNRRLPCLTIAFALAACAGSRSTTRVAAPEIDAVGIRIQGAEALSGTTYLVVGRSTDRGDPIVGILDPSALIPLQRVDHPFAPPIELRDLARLSARGEFLVCAADPVAGPELIHVRLDRSGRSVGVIARYPTPDEGGASPEAVACAGVGDAVRVVLGYPGDGSAAAGFRIGTFDGSRSMQWSTPRLEVRAPLESHDVDVSRIRDCEALYADREGRIWSLATWSGTGDDAGGAALFGLGRIGGDGELELESPPTLTWTGIGIAAEAVAAHPSGTGAMAFGPTDGQRSRGRRGTLR